MSFPYHYHSLLFFLLHLDSFAFGRKKKDNKKARKQTVVLFVFGYSVLSLCQFS